MLEMEKMLNPKLGVTVTRTEGNTEMFGMNVVKKVKVNRMVADPKRVTDICKDIFGKPKKTMEPKRSVGCRRNVPYRL